MEDHSCWPMEIQRTYQPPRIASSLGARFKVHPLLLQSPSSSNLPGLKSSPGGIVSRSLKLSGSELYASSANSYPSNQKPRTRTSLDPNRQKSRRSPVQVVGGVSFMQRATRLQRKQAREAVATVPLWQLGANEDARGKYMTALAAFLLFACWSWSKLKKHTARTIGRIYISNPIFTTVPPSIWLTTHFRTFVGSPGSSRNPFEI